MPSFLVVGSSLLALLAAPPEESSRASFARSVVALLMAALLVAWAVFCTGKSQRIMTQWLFSPLMFAFGPIAGLALVCTLAPTPGAARPLASTTCSSGRRA